MPRPLADRRGDLHTQPHTDALPPAPYPLVALILLIGPLALDAQAVTACLAEREIPLGSEPWGSDAGGIRRPIPGGEMRVVALGAPMALAALETPLTDADWWDTSAVRRHTHVLSVRVASTEQSAVASARLLVRLTAAILDSAEQQGASVAAVLWNDERLLPPEFVQLHATTEPALGVLIGFHVGKAGSGTMLYTSGLPALGLMNMEVAAFDGAIETAAVVLQYWARQLIVAAPLIRDGAVIGDAPTNRARVAIALAAGGQGQVYRLVLDDDDVIMMNQTVLETVVCPDCGKTITADVMHLSFIPILQKCPECGAGPVALLIDMLHSVGGSEVTVTFETTDLASLAKLFSEHDLRFDSVVDASDYLRGRYDGQRAVLQVPRTVAGILSAAVTRAYPGIRMFANEALGVMDPPGSRETLIFHSAPNDTSMEKAIAAARASVGEFIARLEAPQAGDHAFGVKAKLADAVEREVEHMWLNAVRRDGDTFVGTLDAKPQLVKNVSYGQEIRVLVNDISDWAFNNGDAMHGQYTVRVMMESLPRAMQASFRARLVPLPT